MINREWGHISAVSANLNQMLQNQQSNQSSEKLAKQWSSSHYFIMEIKTEIQSIKILLNIACQNHYLDSSCIL